MNDNNNNNKTSEREIGEEDVEAEIPKMNGRKVSWGMLRRVDSLNMEAGNLSFTQTHRASQISWKRTLSLAFQSMGIVYGDIGTSPLYVYSSTFTQGIHNNDDIIGVLSLIIYTLTLVPLLKYVFIVLSANDNGDGGTFALYSLICRYAKVGLMPNQQPEDKELSNYRLEIPSKHTERANNVKQKLETSRTAKIVLFLVTIMGTSMVIGDGVLTPSISVLSAVSGISSLGQGPVVGVSVAILIILFSVQRFGTDKVGFSFAPIVFLWFAFLAGIGLYNLVTHDITVLRAFNPLYIYEYFKRNGRDGWVSLGGIFLCITGTEAMFADLGHFNVRAIQLSFSCVTFPALLTAYIGQAAYLSKFPEHVANTFYDSVPDALYWPTFVVAVAASIIASQAMISGAFAIISQSLALGCFPRVKVVHTSAKYEGQVYIPEVNYILMIACVLVTASFKTTAKIGNAYGIAVVSVMVITTGMVSLIMLIVWKISIWWITLFFVVFGVIEVIFLSSVFYKFTQGGYLPILFALVLMSIMGIWHYVHIKKYESDLKNKVSSEYIRELSDDPNIQRIPGIGLLYSELVQGIPPMFAHFIANVPSIHSVLIFVSIKPIPISKVLLEERFLFRQVEPKDYRIFRCVVRYGYKEVIEDTKEFERQLIQSLKGFIQQENLIVQQGNGNENEVEQEDEAVQTLDAARLSSASVQSTNARKSLSSSNGIVSGHIRITGAEEETQFVDRAKDKGVFYLMGETEVVAERKSSVFKKFIVNHAYQFLKKNSREGAKVLAIPRTRLLKVGMTYGI